MIQFPKENKKIKLAMLGMTEGNGHPYSWSIIINGRYNAEALAQCPYAAIIDYISKQPKNTLGIKDVEVHMYGQTILKMQNLLLKLQKLKILLKIQKM